MGPLGDTSLHGHYQTCVPAVPLKCRFKTEEVPVPMEDKALRIDCKIIPEHGKGKEEADPTGCCERTQAFPLPGFCTFLLPVTPYTLSLHSAWLFLF